MLYSTDFLTAFWAVNGMCKSFRATQMNRWSLGIATACLTTLSLAGCSVGPDYHSPRELANARSFVRQPAQGTQTAPALAQWWLTLHDPLLNQLIESALRDNPDMAMASARLRQARAALNGQQASQLPKVSAAGAMVRTGLPDMGGASISSPLDLYSAAFDASWELDIFGGSRRAVEAAQDQQQASEAALADIYVSIAAEVAKNYLQLCGARQQLAVLDQSIVLQQKMLQLTQQRRERGAASDSDIARLTSQLESTRAQQAPLQADINDALDMLAYLSGKTPGEWDKPLLQARLLPLLPAQVNIGDPATLLRQRPDIRNAERKLAASTAQIGMHKADLFPKIKLFGTLGFASTSQGELWQQRNETWTLVPYLQWNLLDFGRVKAQVAVAQAQRDEALANWQKTLLNALRDANSSLSRFGHQRLSVLDVDQATEASQHASELMRQRYQAGVASLIDLLDTERTSLSAQQNQISAQTQLLVDYVALQKSLGLGWQ
jgi:multidrug efflux system outer membrane protein